MPFDLNLQGASWAEQLDLIGVSTLVHVVVRLLGHFFIELDDLVVQLGEAARLNDLARLDRLLALGASVNSSEQLDSTPLKLACQKPKISLRGGKTPPGRGCGRESDGQHRGDGSAHCVGQPGR